MPINRFYSPSRGQYVSQFVPDQLPAEMMAKGLMMKQGKQDQASAELSAYKNWTQPALAGADTKYVKSLQDKIGEFASESINVDKTSPEYQRKYQELVQGITKDPRLAKITSNYQHHQTALERKKALSEKGATEDERAFQDEYDRRFRIYTSEDGLGSEGDIQLGDANFTEGVHIQKEMEEYFNHIGADKAEGIRKLTGTDIAYSVTSGGKSKNKLQQAGLKAFGDMLQSPVGKQLIARYKAQNIPQTIDGKTVTQQQYLDSLDEEGKKKFNTEMKTSILNSFIGVGESFATSEYSTTKDTALNLKAAQDHADAKERGMIIPGQLAEMTGGPLTLSWEAQAKTLGDKAKALATKIEEVKLDPKAYSPGTLERLQQEAAQLMREKDIQAENKTNAWQANTKKAEAMFEKATGQNYRKTKERLNGHIERLKQQLSPTQQRALEAYMKTGRKGEFDFAKLTPYLLERGKAVGGAGQGNNFHETQKEKQIMGEIKNVVSQIKTIEGTLDKERKLLWNQDYYVKGAGKEFQSFTTVPTGAGSAAKGEEALINHKIGYDFYDATGAPIADDKKGEYHDLKVVGLTDSDFNNNGVGRVLVGKRTYEEQLEDEEGNGIVKANGAPQMVRRTEDVQLITTSNSNNRKVIEGMYGNDYVREAGKLWNEYSLAKQQGNGDVALSKKVQARLASDRALIHFNPELAQQLQEFNDDPSFNTGVTTSSVYGMPMDLSIQRLRDGSFTLQMLDVENPGVPPMRRVNGKDVPMGKETFSNMDQLKAWVLENK